MVHFAFRDGTKTCNAREGKGDFAFMPSGNSLAPSTGYYPAYYSFALYNSVFGSKMISSSTNDDNVKLYASLFTTNQIGTIIINKNLQPITITLQGIQSKQANGWILTSSAPSNASSPLDTFGLAWNGVTSSSGYAGPFPIGGVFSIPPYVLYPKQVDAVQLDVPAVSVIGVVFY